jgi:XFP N-terminal domain
MLAVTERAYAESPVSDDELSQIDAYWRAANYLSVGQIYLTDNALLREPLRPEHIKPRLLGRWGTTPGLNFIYVHLNRVIAEQDLNATYVTAPGTAVRVSSPTPISRAPTARFIPRSVATSGGSERCSASSPSLAESPVTLRRRRPDQFMRAASSATACCTVMGRPSTTPSCWSRA